ncbi:MAG: carboxymuconolactone decarboxylase family protein [Steroidobacteraceae bacterium]|jgi:4-carboxymuconolactone decarboxylase|nr:carboxymuconolactone decarboxylase family protein [Steroidobacteraceae bacterium]
MTRLPPDIDPESRSRLPVVRREALDEATQAAYDEIATRSATSVAGLQGPGGIMLHSPALVAVHRAYNRALRTLPELGPALTELAILVTARGMDQPFEWTTHEPAARAAGLAERTIEVVRQRLPVEGLAPREAIVIRLGSEVFGMRRVRPETYAEAERLLGRRALVSLVAVMASYTGTAVLLTVFDQQLPPGTPSTLDESPEK